MTELIDCGLLPAAVLDHVGLVLIGSEPVDVHGTVAFRREPELCVLRAIHRGVPPRTDGITTLLSVEVVDVAAIRVCGNVHALLDDHAADVLCVRLLERVIEERIDSHPVVDAIAVHVGEEQVRCPVVRVGCWVCSEAHGSNDCSDHINFS